MEGYSKIYDSNASIIASLINQWIMMICEIKGSVRYYSEFFDLFYRFASISPEYTNYLLTKRLVGRLLDFIIESTMQGNVKKQISQHQEEIRKTDDIRVMSTPSNEYFG